MSKIMYIRVSENCNSQCYMCHYAGKKDSYNISQKQYENIIDQMDQKGSYELVRFTGGETLLHPELTRMIEYASIHQYKTSIITNGYFLPQYAEDLSRTGLTQCIVSLDGANKETHDKLRGFNGCFNNLLNGLRRLKESNPNIVLRVNTVVSLYNIEQLDSILKLLEDYQVDQWSIIPLKFKKNLWTPNHRQYYEQFLEHVKNTKISLLGYSANWAGRNEEEVQNTFERNMHFKPCGICANVNYIRFYIPDKNLLLPCNCVPHRLHEITELQSVFLEKDLEIQADKIKEWLAYNSSNICTGCEPLNVYLSDHPDEILKNVLLF